MHRPGSGRPIPQPQGRAEGDAPDTPRHAEKAMKPVITSSDNPRQPVQTELFGSVRRYVRHPFVLDITITAGERTVHCTTTTLALGGCYARCPERFAEEERVDLALVLDSGISIDIVELHARVVYHDGDGMGMEFLNMTRTQTGLLKNFFFQHDLECYNFHPTLVG